MQEQQSNPSTDSPAANELEHIHELLPLLKALADETRLKVLGLLATRAYTVEQLAETLGLRASTVSHHLARLAEVGLVSARPSSYYNVYRFEPQALARAATLLSERVPQVPAPAEVRLPFAEDAVVKRYLGPDGRLKALPAQQKKRLIVLRHCLAAFEPGRRYSQSEVNDILSQFSAEDYVTLRRYLIDYGLMDREPGGGEYWRIE